MDVTTTVSREHGNRGNHSANRSLLPGIHLHWICIIDRSLFNSPDLCSMIKGITDGKQGCGAI